MATTAKPVEPTPGQIQNKAEQAMRKRKVLVTYLLVSAAVGVVVASAMTWRGTGGAAALKMWAMSVGGMLATLIATTPFIVFVCMRSNKSCFALGLLMLVAIPAVFGMTIGTALRLALIAAGR